MLKRAAEAEKQKRLNQFLSENQDPTDEQVHALSEELGIDPDELEEMIYDTLAAYVAGDDQIPGGLADNMGAENFDPGQLSMGEEVEMEHTDNPALAEEIAEDHLAEIPDYYNRLDEMEEEAKEGEEGDTNKDEKKEGR